jgi:hypothetical protein
MKETEEMVEEMPLGAVGMAWTDRADPSSCRVYSRLSEESDGQGRRRGGLWARTTHSDVPRYTAGSALLSKHSGEVVVGRSHSSSS